MYSLSWWFGVVIGVIWDPFSSFKHSSALQLAFIWHFQFYLPSFLDFFITQYELAWFIFKFFELSLVTKSRHNLKWRSNLPAVIIHMCSCRKHRSFWLHVELETFITSLWFALCSQRAQFESRRMFLCVFVETKKRCGLFFFASGRWWTVKDKRRGR